MLAGALAGLCAVAYAHVFGEPQVDLAIAFETARHAAAADPPEPELVSRAVQASWGLLTAGLVYGAGVGGLFSLVFSACYGRIGRLDARSLSALLAAAGFVAIVLAPQFKYPANPPAIGEDATIGLRTALYFEMIAVSIGAMALSVVVGRAVMARRNMVDALLCGAVVYVTVVGAVQWVLPSVNEVPADFPATVLWRFRVASDGLQLALWTVMGLAFGWLAERRLSVVPTARRAAVPR